MFFQKILRNAQGMSMTESALAVGLVGMGALAAASLSGNLTGMVQKSEAIVASSQFASAFGSYLYTSAGCDAIRAQTSYTETPAPLSITNWKYMGLDSFQGGYGADGLKITKTKYFDIQTLEASYEPLDANAPTVKAFEGGSAVDMAKSILKIRLVLMNGKKPSEYYFNIPVLRNLSTGAVGYCSDEKTIAETCASLQGTYDPSLPEGERCKISDGCKVKGYYQTCAPSGPGCQVFGMENQVNPFTHGPSCPVGSVATLTHRSTFMNREPSGKKASVEVPYTKTWYSCLECPAGAAGAP